MENNQNTVEAPQHYNPNQLVTYKVIKNGEVSYPTDKVTQIEYELDRIRNLSAIMNTQSNAISTMENKFTEWLDNDSAAADIVSELCEIFGLDATREVEFEGTARITGVISVPLSEYAEFDIDNIDLFVTVDSYNYSVNADAEIEDVSRTD